MSHYVTSALGQDHKKLTEFTAFIELADPFGLSLDSFYGLNGRFFKYDEKPSDAFQLYEEGGVECEVRGNAVKMTFPFAIDKDNFRKGLDERDIPYVTGEQMYRQVRLPPWTRFVNIGITEICNPEVLQKLDNMYTVVFDRFLVKIEDKKNDTTLYPKEDSTKIIFNLPSESEDLGERLKDLDCILEIKEFLIR